ncbi:MAG: hypothetical protein K8T25_05815, partial [Planctomycetia bacterium]|nr:hypothetical protein [Planctomycetia bacterium]
MQNSAARGFFFIALGMFLMTGCDAAPSADDAPAAKVEANSPAPPMASAQPAGNLQPSEINAFFVDWFKGHGHKDVVVDKQGVGIAGNATRWHGSLYDSKPHGNGRFVVNVACTVLLPSGQKITEFVAGRGKTENEAVHDALVNF